MVDPQSPSETVVSAWVRLLRAQRLALSRVEADLKAAGFPPLGWYDALLELRRAEETGLRPLELESRLLLEQHNISRLVDRLEKAGYLQRLPCPDDRRGQMLRLSEAGGDLLRRMWPSYRAAIRRHVGEKLETDENAAALADLLKRLG
jgi:DNA-binding MarR family transcriptional regulator